ncbi:proton-conducting transporter transmembrane domain-containing protein [Alishewanella longhuensis]
MAKANLFFVAGMMYRLGGSFELKELGGLYKKHPGLAVLFLIPAFSLAGVPPLSGFFAKFILI